MERANKSISGSGEAKHSYLSQWCATSQSINGGAANAKLTAPRINESRPSLPATRFTGFDGAAEPNELTNGADFVKVKVALFAFGYLQPRSRGVISPYRASAIAS